MSNKTPEDFPVGTRVRFDWKNTDDENAENVNTIKGEGIVIDQDNDMAGVLGRVMGLVRVAVDEDTLEATDPEDRIVEHPWQFFPSELEAI